MLAQSTATDVAFLMIAVTQGVFAVVWALGAWIIAETRRATAHWAAYAALSALSFLGLMSALHLREPLQVELVRALGNLCAVFAFILLQRGIWVFLGQPLRRRAHAAALAVSLCASAIGLVPAGGSVRVTVISACLALLAASMAWDLYRQARDRMRLRWPALMALPLLAASAGLAFRAARAAAWPDSVAQEMTRDSPLNVGFAFLYVVIALAFHATLMALVVGRLLADLRHRSRHDGLTGLYNRRAMEETLDQQMQRSRRSGQALSVLMLDLDHFKSINDRFGHGVGDRALKHAAGLLRGELRDVDRVARFGGEEFLVLLPGLDRAGARPVAERLRRCLSDVPLVLEDATISISASIGIAQWGGAAEDLSRWLVRADAALYQAKSQGRNCVHDAEWPPASVQASARAAG